MVNANSQIIRVNDSNMSDCIFSTFNNHALNLKAHANELNKHDKIISNVVKGLNGHSKKLTRIGLLMLAGGYAIYICNKKINSLTKRVEELEDENARLFDDNDEDS